MELKNKIDLKKIKQRYTELYSEKSKWVGLWNDIGRFIRIEKQNLGADDPATNGNNIDQDINDPSSVLSISASASNLYGIFIGDGNFISLEPSEETEQDDEISDEVKDYLEFVSKRILKELNSENANFKKCFLEHLKDQQTFGTSGIGEFISNDYIKGKSENVFDFMSFGVDNITIDEGRNGLIDTIYVNYNWRINKIINTFCLEDGKFSDEKFNALPDKLKKSYENNPNDRYNIYLAIVDNEFFKRGTIGKLSAKYMGIWYIDNIDYILDLEFYKNMPIHIVRADKLRGEIYGRADGTKCLSSVKLLNYLMGEAIEVIEKFTKPANAIVDGSLTGDKVIDTTPGSWTAIKLPNGVSNPIFPLEDVKDPTALIQVLIPYLRENISTAFKTDILLDMNSQTAKSATEVLKRYDIRSKMLYSILFQQINELIYPMIENMVDILYNLGEIGHETMPIGMEQNDRSRNILIPEVIQKLQRNNKKWYKIKFNSEVYKMQRSGELENISQFMIQITSLSQFYPDAIQMVDWYKILAKIENLLNAGESYLISKSEYETIKQGIQDAQAQAAMSQNALMNSQVNSNNANAINKLSQTML